MNQPDVTSKDRFLSSRQRYQPIALPEDFSNETLSHVSLLPFRHVLPNGTYFIENS